MLALLAKRPGGVGWVPLHLTKMDEVECASEQMVEMITNHDLPASHYKLVQVGSLSDLYDQMYGSE